MSFAVGVRVEKHVALQTQPLDTRGALSVNRGDPTDAAGLYRHKQQPVKHQQKQSANFRMNSRFKALGCHTLLGFLYLVPLVIGSGGVAVKEVITGVTEWLTVT